MFWKSRLRLLCNSSKDIAPVLTCRCRRMRNLAVIRRLVSVLVHKILMEFGDPTHPLRSRGQKGGAEMQCALFLTKSRAGNDTDAGRLEQADTVEIVGLATILLCSGDSLSWKMDGWEEVH